MRCVCPLNKGVGKRPEIQPQNRLGLERPKSRSNDPRLLPCALMVYLTYGRPLNMPCSPCGCRGSFGDWKIAPAISGGGAWRGVGPGQDGRWTPAHILFRPGGPPLRRVSVISRSMTGHVVGCAVFAWRRQPRWATDRAHMAPEMVHRGKSLLAVDTRGQCALVDMRQHALHQVNIVLVPIGFEVQVRRHLG